jgi:hypothetical protein
MVDSVIFKVHDLFANQKLVKALDNPVIKQEGKRVMVKKLDVPLDKNKEIFLKRYYVDAASGNSYPEHFRGFFKSSNYDVAYSINYNRDFIEFNISLPKYWFGNNLCQLTDHWLDNHFLHFKNSPFWNCKAFAFERFRQVFNHFLAALPFPVDKSHIEITRLDLCFNLIFRNETDALYYLSELMHVKRKRWRNTQAAITNYLGQSIYFASKDYTFKVYHKAAEFRKNDFNKVKKRFGKDVAERILKLAGNVLRYEIELRPGMLTQIFHSALKKENIAVYKTLKANRQVTKNGYVVLNNGERANFDGMDNEGKKVYRKFDPEIRRQMAIGKAIMAKDIQFRIATDSTTSLNRIPVESMEVKNGKLHGYDHKECFDYELFSMCVDKFKDVFMHFQIGHLDHLNKIQIALEQNRLSEFTRALKMDGKERVDERKVRQIIDLLKEYSWDQIKAKDFMSPTTFYKYKKLFDSAGIKQKNTGYNTGVKFTYDNYYSLVFADFNYISKRQKF